MKLRFSSPYSILDNCRWLWYFFAGPRKDKTAFLQGAESPLIFSAEKPDQEIVFFGDIMSMQQKKLTLGENLRDWIAGAQYCVVNLEGVIYQSSEWAWIQQYHSENIVANLREIFPSQKIIVSLANNHAGDYGSQALQHTVQKLKLAGIEVVGLSEQHFLTDSFSLVAASQWQNITNSMIEKLSAVKSPAAPGLKILYAHWGHEFELYPRKSLVEQSQKLVESWDVVIGSHPHTPQPIVRTKRGFVAYSLGNLGVWFRWPQVNNGLGLKISLKSGVLVQAQWKKLKIDAKAKDRVITELAE